VTDPESAEPTQGANAHGSQLALKRLLRLWLLAVIVLAALGWCATVQPFYRPVQVGVGLTVVILMIWRSWHVSGRRGLDRRHFSRRRRRRRD
jgi:hypothetical protein